MTASQRQDGHQTVEGPARGRPKATWRKTAEKGRNTTGWKSKVVAQKQAVLVGRESVKALCAYWRDEKR